MVGTGDSTELWRRTQLSRTFVIWEKFYWLKVEAGEQKFRSIILKKWKEIGRYCNLASSLTDDSVGLMLQNWLSHTQTYCSPYLQSINHKVTRPKLSGFVCTFPFAVPGSNPNSFSIYSQLYYYSCRYIEKRTKTKKAGFGPYFLGN